MYRIIGTDGKTYGPVALEHLRQWIAQGRAESRTPVFVDGASDWTFLGLLPELAGDFAGTPPCIGAVKPVAASARGTNGFATAGFICGLLAWTCCCCAPFNLLGLVFSIIALAQISSQAEPQEGRALAIIGLVLSGANLLFGLGFGLLAVFAAAAAAPDADWPPGRAGQAAFARARLVGEEGGGWGGPGAGGAAGGVRAGRGLAPGAGGAGGLCSGAACGGRGGGFGCTGRGLASGAGRAGGLCSGAACGGRGTGFGCTGRGLASGTGRAGGPCPGAGRAGRVPFPRARLVEGEAEGSAAPGADWPPGRAGPAAFARARLAEDGAQGSAAPDADWLPGRGGQAAFVRARLAEDEAGAAAPGVDWSAGQVSPAAFAAGPAV